MKFVIYPDSFKDCMSAATAASTISQAILALFPNAKIKQIPMTDGGEGFIDALLNVCDGKVIACRVQNPLGQPRTASFG